MPKESPSRLLSKFVCLAEGVAEAIGGDSACGRRGSVCKVKEGRGNSQLKEFEEETLLLTRKSSLTVFLEVLDEKGHLLQHSLQQGFFSFAVIVCTHCDDESSLAI